MMKYLTDQDQKDLTNSIVVTISGNPIPLQRPRLRSYANQGSKVFDSQKDLKYKVGLQLKSYINFFNKVSFLDGNLSLKITFYFELPNSWPIKKKEKVSGKRKRSRPDLTNLIKFYEDFMQDIDLFKDDAQIVEITAQKLYDDGQGPRVEIILKEIDNAT